MPNLKTRNAINTLRTIAQGVYSLTNPLHPLHPISRHHGARVMILEGFISSSEAMFFTRLLQRERWIKRVLEVGFNGGHSSFTFLGARQDIEVVSFDLGVHRYVPHAKSFIDFRFPGRHRLILGSSPDTIPGYARSHPDERFDLLFIDGGHTFEIASNDLVNCRMLANKKNLVAIDDLAPWNPWGVGPTEAWRISRDNGLVIEEGLYCAGKRLNSVNRDFGDNIWAVGRYLHPGRG